jgi:D-alanyl-D-alanine endopeptidase (penicillin-binding protein 7)
MRVFAVKIAAVFAVLGLVFVAPVHASPKNERAGSVHLAASQKHAQPRTAGSIPAIAGRAGASGRPSKRRGIAHDGVSASRATLDRAARVISGKGGLPAAAHERKLRGRRGATVGAVWHGGMKLPAATAQQTSLAPHFDSLRGESSAWAGRRSIARATGLHSASDPLDLNSAVALVQDQETGRVLYEKNSGAVLPIASITKLMTALVVIESGDSRDELIEITQADVDTEKHSSSRVRVGTTLSRAELLQLALMSSENRAAHALARRSRVGLTAFIAAMNAKARALGMQDTQYLDPTGLSSRNVSTARDLALLVRAASEQPLIRQFSTATDMTVAVPNTQIFRNTNRLIRSGDWEIDVSKTGYISEAGRCLVMQVRIQGRPTTVVLLDALASQSRATDAVRIRRWLETTDSGRRMTS